MHRHEANGSMFFLSLFYSNFKDRDMVVKMKDREVRPNILCSQNNFFFEMNIEGNIFLMLNVKLTINDVIISRKGSKL